MKHSCELVRDLLPLYHDEVCSAQSKQIVEEHLAECGECTKLMTKIKDETYDARLSEERGNVVGRHMEAVKRKSMTLGVSLACVLTVPVIVCLIVNLSVGRALDWFFIVLTSLMVLASVTVVPLIVGDWKWKGMWTLCSFTGSLILLLLTCSLYTGGDWFFLAVVPILFGLSVIFAPYVLDNLPLKGFASRHKGLLAMAADTVLLFAVITTCGLYIGGTYIDYWRPALMITSYCLILPWVLFGVIRYLKVNGYIIAGICVIFDGLFLISINGTVEWILSGIYRHPFMGMDLFRWVHYVTINANINFLLFLTCIIIGGVLILVGMINDNQADKRKSNL